MLARDIMDNSDAEYLIRIRRELHEHPEVGFDLPETVKIVERELDAMGIEHTRKYGKGSVVGYLNWKNNNFTVAIRADMDALPVEERTGLPFSSKNPGIMHACGHDAHTAMLLCAARTMKKREQELPCRVKLIFQPSEEGAQSGARMMVEAGVMDDVDIVIGQHVDNNIDGGKIGLCPGEVMASCTPITLNFFGKSAHATLPQTGCDALAMAVKTYNGIQFMLTRQLNPFARWVCSVGSMNAGNVHNVIPDAAEMKISLRTYDMELQKQMVSRIRMIAEDAARELEGTVEMSAEISAYPVINDKEICNRLINAAEKVVGEKKIVYNEQKMSSEDFSWYLTKKPGVFYVVGTRNPEIGAVTQPHNSDFMIDESQLINGSMTVVQFVLDT